MVPWPSEKPLVRVICAGLIGNVMEWYDFSLYGYFAVTIGREFFRTHSPVFPCLPLSRHLQPDSSFDRLVASFSGALATEWEVNAPC